MSIVGPFTPIAISESGTVSSSVTMTTVPVNVRSHFALDAPSVCATVTVCLSSESVSPEEAEPVNWLLPMKVATTGGEVLENAAGPACRVVATVVAADCDVTVPVSALRSAV